MYRGEKLTQIISDFVKPLSNHPNLLLHELLQNSDDAGSAEFHLYLDETESTHRDLWDPQMSEFQGPALYAANSSIFSNDDFEGFLKVRQGSKSSNKYKIGRYGAGMMSVFLVTDLLSFVTGDCMFFCESSTYSPDLVVHDPHSRYFDGTNTYRVPLGTPVMNGHVAAFRY